MQQHGIAYTLEGPDGTTVVLDGTGQASSVLLLTDVTGLDSPAIRSNIEDLPEDDGAAVGDFWMGARSIILTGVIYAATAAERNAAIANLSRAAMALRDNATLRFQPDGMPALEVVVRRDQPLRLGRGYAKEFQLSLVAPDPRLYAEAMDTATATGLAAIPGAAFPWVFPLSFGGSSGATLSTSAANEGNHATPPTVRVWGPLSSIQITNETTDEDLFIDGVTLLSGEWVEIDFAARTAVREDGSNVYDRVRFPGSTWWLLRPGANVVELWATGSDASTEIDVSWKDAWV
jgi:hypothetical protein